MSKKSSKSDAQEKLFDETKEVIDLLKRDEPMHSVMLWVPDTIGTGEKAKKISNARINKWVTVAREVFADCFTGATCFNTHSGVWKDSDGEYHYDQPIIIQTVAPSKDIEGEENLNMLVGLAKRMGKELHQQCILILVGKARFYISDYSGI